VTYFLNFIDVTYLGHYDLLFTFHSRGKSCLSQSYIKYCFMHDHQTWYSIFVKFIYVIYRQTSITVNTHLT